MDNNISEARHSYALVVGKFTQEDAAKWFSVSLGTYRNWEQGVGKLNGEILCNIAEKYGCSVDYLLCRTDDPRPYPKHSDICNPDEQRLLDSYRKMDEPDREKLRGVAETFVVASEKNGAREDGDVDRIGSWTVVR